MNLGAFIVGVGVAALVLWAVYAVWRMFNELNDLDRLG